MTIGLIAALLAVAAAFTAVAVRWRRPRIDNRHRVSRILVLVTPEPRSQRILRRAFRSGQRLGSEIDALWVRKPGQQLSEAETTSLASLRRLASILGAHFIELEGDSLPDTVKRFVGERGSTYVFLGTPDDSRRTEILRGSLVSKLVRELHGVDIRVVADRALREEQP